MIFSMVLNRTKLNKGTVMGPLYLKELAMRIISDVKDNNPNATPKDIVARLEYLGFAQEFASEIVELYATDIANYNNQ